jgi:hypothetical protein
LCPKYAHFTGPWSSPTWPIGLDVDPLHQAIVRDCRAADHSP